MVDFASIQNDILRTLAMSSTAIATLDEVKKAEMISSFASATPEEQTYYISVLEGEKQSNQLIDDKWSEELNSATQEVEAAMDELNRVQREYDTAVRTGLEDQSRIADNERAEQILAELENIDTSSTK